MLKRWRGGLTSLDDWSILYIVLLYCTDFEDNKWSQSTRMENGLSVYESRQCGLHTVIGQLRQLIYLIY